MTWWGVAISHEQALPLVRPEESELLPIPWSVKTGGRHGQSPGAAFGLGGQEMEH